MFRAFVKCVQKRLPESADTFFGEYPLTSCCLPHSQALPQNAVEDPGNEATVCCHGYSCLHRSLVFRQ